MVQRADEGFLLLDILIWNQNTILNQWCQSALYVGMQHGDFTLSKVPLCSGTIVVGEMYSVRSKQNVLYSIPLTAFTYRLPNV